jgi:preprotein translocase subunit SecY
VIMNFIRRKKNNPMWKVVFTPLLIINAVFFIWAGYVMTHRGPTADLTGIVIPPLALPLLIIDFFSVFFYIIKVRPHGIGRGISYIALISISLVLIYDIWILLSHYVQYDISLIILNPLIGLLIVATLFLVILYFRQKPRK